MEPFVLPSLDQVLDSMSDSFSVIDRDWRLVYVNPVAVKGLGLIDKTDLVGKNIWDEFPEFVGSEPYHHYMKAMKEGTPVTFESYYPPLDIYSITNVYPFAGGIAVYSQDISERMRAERSSREQKDRLQLATASGRLGLWDFFPQTGKLEWDDRCKEIFGLAPSEEVSYERFLALLHEEDRERVDAAVQLAFLPSSPDFEVDYRIQRTDGTYTYAVARGRSYFEGEGDDIKVSRFIGTLTDITARHMQDMELEAQREWLHVTMNSIGDAVITTDTQGQVTYLNPVAEALTGWQLTEAQGKLLIEVFHIINEQTLEVQENPVQKVLEHGTIVGLANHTILISKSGDETPIEDSAAPIRNSKNEIIGVVLVFHDATSSRKAEELLKRTNRRIARILEGIGEGFFSVDREWNILFANEKAQGILQTMKEDGGDVVGRNLWAEYPDLIWTDIYEKYHHAVRTQEPVEFEFESKQTGNAYKVRAFPSLEGLSVFMTLRNPKAEGAITD